MAQPPEWWSCQWGSSRRSACLHGDATPSEEWTPSGYCNQTGCVHLQAACQQRSTSAGLGECLPCPGSWPWRSRWCQMAQPPRWLSCQSRSWQRSAYHHADVGPSGGLTPSGCCSQTGSFHPQVAFRQRSTSADLGECPPCPGSWPWRSQWCLRAQPPRW